MKKFLPASLILLALIFSSGWIAPSFSQSKTVRIKQTKGLPNANEFVLVWEGQDYKTTYYEVKSILDNEPAVQKQVFLWRIRSISAIVSEEKDMNYMLSLFRSQGFEAFDHSEESALQNHRKMKTQLLTLLLLILLPGAVLFGQTYTQTTGSVSTCSGTFYDSGDSFGNYSNGENSVFTICSNSGNCLRVNFTSFEIESGFDFLFIYDGASTGAPLIGVYTGLTSPGTIFSTSGCLTFEFQSDGSVTDPGWVANISCVSCGAGPPPCLPNMGNCRDSVCTGTFFDSGGAFGNYGNGESFTHTICSNAGNCVAVNFTSFDLESGFDELTIHDGPSAASPVIGIYSGTSSPGTVPSTSGCLTFVFTSDGSVTRAGWQANISCGACSGGGGGGCLPNMANCLDSTCTGSFFDSGGSSGSYSNGENLVHTICSDAGNCVEVDFTAFNTESGFDFLTIYDGPSTAFPVLGTYTGTNSPGTVQSSTGCLTFQFISDGSVTSSGWQANVSCGVCGAGPGGCLPNMGNACLDSVCSGSFFDSGGSSGQYGNNENNTHTICSNAGDCVQFDFTSFDLESCCDQLAIHDGPSPLSPLIGTFAGSSPGTVTSTSGCLTFVFTSDGSVTRDGWEAAITCVPCPATGCLPIMTNACTDLTCSNSFFDSGGNSGNYGNNENLTHTISSNAGNCIQVDFTSFDLENGFDFLYVHDGASTNTPLLGVYTGNISPGTVVGTSGSLTFQFISDGTNTSNGWTANVSCTSCPPTTSCIIDPVSNAHGFPPGFSQACDDACSSNLLPLGFTYDICGLNFTSMYVNMNGNVTFGNVYTTYTPVGMPNNTTAVMVAPFWADVDTRGCGTVYYRANASNVIVTWYQVGYFSSNCDKRNTFQLVMTNGFDPLIGIGNNTAFYFENMEWTTGDVTGTNGFAGAPATVGVNANDGLNHSAIGRFDHAGLGYDGPTGTADGVDYLDDRCYVFPAGGCNVILPVDYLKISATAMDGSWIALDWSTNSEFNNVGFDIERSTDGEHFTKIGFREGSGQQGGALMEYRFSDRDVERNRRYYYRLVQHDQNGLTATSTVVSARITDNNATAGKVYPNPFNDGIFVELTSERSGTCEAHLYDALGHEVGNWQHSVIAGDQALELETGDLSQGIYFLHVYVDGKKVALEKLVK